MQYSQHRSEADASTINTSELSEDDFEYISFSCNVTSTPINKDWQPPHDYTCSKASSLFAATSSTISSETDLGCWPFSHTESSSDDEPIESE